VDRRSWERIIQITRTLYMLLAMTWGV
jgi:hypothetical protein